MDSPKISVLGYKEFILITSICSISIHNVAVVVFKMNFFKDKKCLSKHNWNISVHKIYFSTDQFLYSVYLERGCTHGK